MKFKKLFCVLTAALLLLFLSAACAKTETPKESAPSGETQTDAAETTKAAQPPEGKPEGTQPGDPPDGGTEGMPPAPPDGNGGPGGMPPDGNGGPGGMPPDGNGGPGGTPPDGNGGPGGMPPGGGPGGGSADLTYSGATEIDAPGTRSGETYASDSADQNALLITASGDVTLSEPTVTKRGDSGSGDTCSFYGVNAAVLAKDGAAVTLSGGSVSSDAEGANALFCYGGNGGRNGAEGDGTTLTVRNTKIRTAGGGSGGIMTTGGGVTYAYDLDVETAGRSSAPIRTDRGGGRVYVYGGRYVSNGLGSPAIYSTAEIHAENAALISNLSEGVCIEGRNSVELMNCTLTAKNTSRNSNACFLDSVMLYQSMSGDAAAGSACFTMSGGSLTSKNGHVFHVTNTEAVISLRGVAIVNEDPENILLSVCADGWSGAKNSATLKAAAQELNGAIKVGSDSALRLELTEGSCFTGSIDGQIANAKGETVSAETGSVTVYLDAGSVWRLSGDSRISALEGDPACVVSNGYILYVNGVPLSGTR